MATTNPATLKLSEADDTPVQVYKGIKKRKLPDVSQWSGLSNLEIDEDFYQDVTGNPITNFDPKKHKVVGDIKDGIRVPFSENQPMPSWMPKFAPAYSGPMARQQPYSGPMARPTGNQSAPFKIPSLKPQSTPDAVRASAQTSPAQEARQKSVAEQQADYLRSRGMRTAVEADTEFESNLRKDYSEATGFDINTAEGRRKSFQAALQRGGHADAMARNLRAGKYAYLDPNSEAGRKAVNSAYEKRFAPPKKEPREKGGWFPEMEREETPDIRSGGDWVGNNPLTGEFKDREGNIWGSERAFDISQRGEAGMVESDEMPSFMDEKFSWEDPQNDPLKDAVRMGGLPAGFNNPADIGPDMKGYDQQKFDFLKARVRANALGDNSLDGMSSLQYFDPNFLHHTKGNAVNDLGRDPSAGYAPDTSNVVPSSRWAGGSDTERMFLPALPNTTLQQDIFARRNTWTPQKGGLKNGVWMSRGDSEPQAGGNYGPQVNTWTPQAGGMFNGTRMSPADSEPQQNGYYGIPQFIRRQKK